MLRWDFLKIIFSNEEVPLTRWKASKEVGVKKIRQTNFMTGLVDDAQA